MRHSRTSVLFLSFLLAVFSSSLARAQDEVTVPSPRCLAAPFDSSSNWCGYQLRSAAFQTSTPLEWKLAHETGKSTADELEPTLAMSFTNGLISLFG